MDYCLFHLCWSCVLGCVLPVEVVLIVSMIPLDFDSWMKLILMMIFPCYLYLKISVDLLYLVCLLVCYFGLSFFSNWCCFSYVLKCQSREIPCFFLYFNFLLNHSLSGSSSIELFEFSFLQHLFSDCFFVFNFTLNHFKWLLICVAFQRRLCSAYFTVVASIVLSQS